MRSNTIRVSAAVIVVVGLMAGCGSDDDKADEPSASTAAVTPSTDSAPESSAATSAAPDTTATSDSGSTPAPSSDEPIKVMLTGTFAGAGTGAGNSPESETSALARYNAQNDEQGGINGRQIEVIVCNDQANPDVASNCARQAMEEGVMHAVQSPIANGTGAASLPILEAAGIAYFGNVPQSPADFTTPNSFPFTSGSGAALAATTIAMAREGCTKVAPLAYSTGISAPSIAFIERAIQGEGGEMVAAVEVTPDSPDYAAAIATALDAGAECIVPVTTPNDVVKVVKSVEESGSGIQVGALVSQFPGATLESLGDSAEGILASDTFYSYLSDEPAVVKYRDEVGAAGEEILGRTGLSAWTGAELFIKVAEGLENPTAESFMDALNNLQDMDLGTLPPFSMNEELDSEGFNRAFIRTVFISQVEGGAFHLFYDEPIDTTSTFP